MTDNDKSLSHRVRLAFRQTHGEPVDDRRHPLRNTEQYGQSKSQAAQELDALYERIVEAIRGDIAAIDSTVGDIAGPMADKLAKGAVVDMFEAAAEVLKREIRSSDDNTGSSDD